MQQHCNVAVIGPVNVQWISLNHCKVTTAPVRLLYCPQGICICTQTVRALGGVQWTSLALRSLQEFWGSTARLKTNKYQTLLQLAGASEWSMKQEIQTVEYYDIRNRKRKRNLGMSHDSLPMSSNSLQKWVLQWVLCETLRHWTVVNRCVVCTPNTA